MRLPANWRASLPMVSRFDPSGFVHFTSTSALRVTSCFFCAFFIELQADGRRCLALPSGAVQSTISRFPAGRKGKMNFDEGSGITSPYYNKFYTDKARRKLSGSGSPEGKQFAAQFIQSVDHTHIRCPELAELPSVEIRVFFLQILRH